MARGEHQFRIRMPEDLWAEIIEQAEKNTRSINAEIVARLRNSLGWDRHNPDEMAKDIENLKRRVDSLLDEIRYINRAAERAPDPTNAD